MNDAQIIQQVRRNLVINQDANARIMETILGLHLACRGENASVQALLGELMDLVRWSQLIQQSLIHLQTKEDAR